MHVVQSPQSDTTQSTGQAWSLHCWVSVKLGHATPPWFALVSTLRDRVRKPPPHDFEHVPYSEKLLTTQCTGQCGLFGQSRVCCNAGQAAPPCAAAISTERDRVSEPPSPHDTEHKPHCPHADTWQSTGQACVLQSRVCCRLGHTVPLFCDCVVMDLDRVWRPPSHDSVQALQLPHADTSQSTGHGPASHAPTSVRLPHCTPPCWAAVSTLRLRVLVPVAHVTVHGEYAPQADTTQSTGQGCSLQDRAWSSAGHAAPPWAGDVVTLLDRVCVPLPQLWVHGVQSLNADTTQSTGHGCSLHGCVSFKAGHATPPCAACVVIVRCRILEPPPHDWLHVELAPQSDTTQSTGQSCVLHARFWLTSVLHDTPPF